MLLACNSYLIVPIFISVTNYLMIFPEESVAAFLTTKLLPHFFWSENAVTGLALNFFFIFLFRVLLHRLKILALAF